MVNGLLIVYKFNCSNNTTHPLILYDNLCMWKHLHALVFWGFGLAPKSANIGGERIMTYNAASHKKAIQIFDFTFMELSCSLTVVSDHLHFVF